MKYATGFKRLIAFLIDLCVIIAGELFIGLLLRLDPIYNSLSILPILGLWWIGGLIGLAWLYYACFESSPWRATLGKKLLGLEVVDLMFQRISFGRASARYFAKYVSRFILSIGLLMVFFTKKKQALHDKMASTLVIEH